MTTGKDAKFEIWRDYYADSDGSQYPTESLVRLFKGGFIPEMGEAFRSGTYKGRRALEVGCGNGINLTFLGSLGLEIAGVEVHADILPKIEERLGRHGLSAELKVGENLSLPFADESFDYVVSWQVIHYVENADEMTAAVEEYCRVLKPGGRAIIGTTGPAHSYRENAIPLGESRFQVTHNMDHTSGQTFFYFTSPQQIRRFACGPFDDVLIGRSTEDLFNYVNDYYLIAARKPRGTGAGD